MTLEIFIPYFLKLSSYKDNVFFYLRNFFWDKGNFFENINNCYLGLYPELFLIFIVSLFIGFLVLYDNIFQYRLILSVISAKILIVLLILTLLLLNNIESNFLMFNQLLIVDSFSVWIKNIILISLICVIYMSIEYIKFEKIMQYEYFLLVSLALLGMFTLVSSNDLITLYIGIELQSLAFYILATIKVYSNFSTEAGLKYFILGAFSSGLLLFGSSFIYGSLGTTNFSEIKLLYHQMDWTTPNPNSLILGLIFVIIAILFKLGAAPFHMWIPDVYEGVPTSVTSLFSIVPKIAIFTLFLRLNISLFYENNFFLNKFFLYSAITSIIIGSLGALYQTKFKRLLAYSAISHVGFLLIGFYSLDSLGIFSLFFYIVVYIIISINIFTFILVLRKVDNKFRLKKINEIVVLFKSNKLLAINFTVILFSIAGIPPLVGFYSKYYIFFSAIKSEIYLIALIAALFSVMASLYYIRLIKLMFFKKFDYWVLFFDLSKVDSILLSVTFFFNIFFFCYPEVIVLTIYNVILELFW